MSARRFCKALPVRVEEIGMSSSPSAPVQGDPIWLAWDDQLGLAGAPDARVFRVVTNREEARGGEQSEIERVLAHAGKWLVTQLPDYTWKLEPDGGRPILK